MSIFNYLFESQHQRILSSAILILLQLVAQYFYIVAPIKKQCENIIFQYALLKNQCAKLTLRLEQLNNKERCRIKYAKRPEISRQQRVIKKIIHTYMHNEKIENIGRENIYYVSGLGSFKEFQRLIDELRRTNHAWVRNFLLIKGDSSLLKIFMNVVVA